MRKLLLFCFVAFVCAGCVDVPLLDSQATVDPGEGYFVMGVTPHNLKVAIWSGDVENGRFVQIGSLNRPPYANTPLDGYIVGQTHGKEAVAIWYIEFKTEDNSRYTGQAFVPCQDTKTYVIQIPPGKVVYMGDANFGIGDGGAYSSSGYDFEKARDFMKTHYPNLANRLETGHYQRLPTDRGGNCNIE
jgi:hypothetical protein